MYVIEIMNPDGPHWFGGIKKHAEAAVAGYELPMNLWSPYQIDAKYYMTRIEAEHEQTTTLKAVPGCQVKAVSEALFADSRTVSKQYENACTMRAKYLQQGDVFIMTNTRYFVSESNAETITFHHVNVDALKAGQPYDNGYADRMTRRASYWIVLLGTVSILKPQTQKS